MKKLMCKLESTNIDSFGISRTDFTRTQKSHRRYLINSTIKLQTDSSEYYDMKIQRLSQQKCRNTFRRANQLNLKKVPSKTTNSQDIYQKSNRQQQLSQYIIKFYSDEISTLKDIQGVVDFEIDNYVSKYLIEAQMSIDILIKKLQFLQQYNQNREKNEQEMKDIIQECFKQKNVCIQQRFCYIFGKMEQLFLNTISGAIYFKLCKRLSDNEQFY